MVSPTQETVNMAHMGLTTNIPAPLLLLVSAQHRHQLVPSPPLTPGPKTVSP